jgi:hypothetical protein
VVVVDFSADGIAGGPRELPPGSGHDRESRLRNVPVLLCTAAAQADTVHGLAV